MLPEVNSTFPTDFNKDRIKTVLSTVAYKNVENRKELGLYISDFLGISWFLYISVLQGVISMDIELTGPYRIGPLPKLISLVFMDHVYCLHSDKQIWPEVPFLTPDTQQYDKHQTLVNSNEKNSSDNRIKIPFSIFLVSFLDSHSQHLSCRIW